MKLTEEQLRAAIRESLIKEGWLDRFKSKAWGKAKGAEAKLKGKSRDDDHGAQMAQLDFSAKARKRFAQQLENMAVEMETDVEKMGFDASSIGAQELAEISAILRQAAEKISNVDDISRAKRKAEELM